MNDRMYIYVLVKEPNRNPVVRKMRNEISSIERILGGDFDLIEYDPYSFIAYNYKSRCKRQVQIGNHLINGTILIIGNNPVEGDFRTLTSEQIQDFSKELSAHNTKVIQEMECDEDEI